MRAILAAGFIVIAMGAAAADPVRLACAGEKRFEIGGRPSLDSLFVVIDGDLITIHGYGPAEITGKGDGIEVGFAGQRDPHGYGVAVGHMNRYTGQLSAILFSPGTTGGPRFDGQCKPATRLF